MKKLTLVSLLGLLVLMVGCSKKKSTQPEPEPDYTLEASQTIGSAGGTITASDFSLTIPTGAFISNTTLKLYASSKDKPFGDRSATRTFKLEGLPDEYSQPMKLCIKYQGTLSNAGYIAAGGMQTIPGSDELKPAFSLFPATDSSGYLCVELPAMEKSQFTFLGRSNKLNSGADGTSLMIFVGTQDYDPPKVTPHFKIYCYSDLSESWKFVLTLAVETAYDSLKALGFNLDLVPWPINVYTLYFVGEDTTRHCVFSPIYGSFNLVVNDVPMLHNRPEYLLTIRAAIIRELAHAILCTYDKEYFNVLLFHTVKINPQHYWLHHAVASWCEKKMVDQLPLDFLDSGPTNPYAPFRGMQAGAKDDLKSSLNHGGGMSSAIEFLTLNYREDVIWRIYELGIKNGMHPVEAIMNSVEEEAYEWWPNFFKEYVGSAGAIYGFPVLYYCTSGDALPDTFSVQSKNDTSFIFFRDYPDLSAKPYAIRLNYADVDTIKFITESSTVEPEDVMIIVFGEAESGLATFFTKASQQVNIGDVSQLIKDGYKTLVAVVVNSSYNSQYTGTSEIDLEVKVVPKSGFDYNSFSMGTWVTGHWYRSDGSDYVYKANPLYCCKGYGECSGYTFTSAWDTAFIDGHSKGSATITVDPSLSKVTSFSATDTTWGIYFGVTETTFVSMSGTNLPFYYGSAGYLEFRKDGTEACNYVLSLDYMVRSSLGGWVDVADYSCDSTSYMVITLYKE